MAGTSDGRIRPCGALMRSGMLWCMRTTVTMDDQVFREAKIAAIKAGRTFSDFVEDAVRRELPRKAFTFTVSTAGGGLLPGIDLDNVESMMDEEEWLRKHRAST